MNLLKTTAAFASLANRPNASAMANREICDVKHPSIKDADELWIFCHKENRFKVFSRADYPKPKGSICQLCPNGMKRTNDLVIFCQTKVETWSTLKSHLVTIER